jgi:hypothetical protein
MDRLRKWDWALDVLWLLAWFAGSSAWCLTAGKRLGPVFDEATYVTRGLDRWRTGNLKRLMRLGTMPLPVDLMTLPLYLREVQRGQPFNPLEDLDVLLPAARAVTLGFWCLLLIYTGLAARRLAGPWAGRLAVALVACEPCFLAHASLATTDIAVTACLVALVYHFQAGREAGWFRRRALPAFWFGAAVLSKASALVFGPLFLGVVELERLARSGALGQQSSWLGRGKCLFQSLRKDLIWIWGGGMVLVFVYCGSDWQAEPSFVAWARGLPEGFPRRVMVWSAEHLRIFSNAGEGLVQQVKHNVRGHGTYLLGHRWPRACWYYFWVVPVIKLSLPLLLLPVAVALVRPRALLNWACLAAAAVLLLSPAFRVQLGIRLVLPVIALAVAGLAAAAVSAWGQLAAPVRRRVLAAGLAGGVLWKSAAVLAVWPHGLCYTNELWGGPRKGYLYVSDTDYDWGQGVRDLLRWQRRRGLPVLDVWYFGTDPAVRKPPLRELPLYGLPLKTPADVWAHVRGHYLAVNTTILYGGYGMNLEAYQQAVAFLHTQRPIGRTMTFFIYDFTR